MPTPERAPSSPLLMSALLERIYRLLRGDLRTFIEIGLVPMAFAGLLGGVMAAVMLATTHPWRRTNQAPDLGTMGIVFAVVMVLELALFLLYALFEAAATHATLQLDRGHPVSWSEAYGVAWRHAGRYAWAQILRLLILGVPVLLGMAVLLGVSVISHGWARGHIPHPALVVIPVVVFYIGVLVYCVFAMIRLALVFPASLAESLTGWEAIRRSLEMTRTAKGRIFVVGLVICLLNYAGILVLEFGFGLVGFGGVLAVKMFHVGAPFGIPALILLALVFIAGVLAWSAATCSAFCIGFTLVYGDQKLRMGEIAPAAVE